jgi:hypothetical protein
MGGLEVPRLLLASRDRHARGIGNAHDHVGRHYMCHIAGSLGEVQVAGDPRDHWHSYQVADDGVYCRRRFALRAQASSAYSRSAASHRGAFSTDAGETADQL